MTESAHDPRPPLPDVSRTPLDLLGTLDDALLLAATRHILTPVEGNALRLWEQGSEHQPHTR
jgi:hypothetical protein